ncbi:MAG: MFS transporter [Ornithinibacter sp.]
MTTEPAPREHAAPPWLAVAAIVLVATNLRTLMASLPPLAETIRADLGISSAWLGVLTTLPVLCMGLLAPVANQLARRVGSTVAVGAGIVLVLSGLVVRGLGGGQVWSLYAGTLVAGTGIALAGTLLPGVVKAVFPAHRSGLGTGLTMLAMMGTAAVASAAAVPLSTLFGDWSASLLSWVPLAGVAVLVWAAARRTLSAHSPTRVGADDVAHHLPWRSTTAWLLAAYLTCQSWQFYSSLAWLAPTYESHGFSARDAGLIMAVFTGVQLVSGLVSPALLDHVSDPRVLILAAAAVGTAGLLGVWLAPEAAPWVWAFLLGAGQGGCFSLGLGLLVRLTVTPRDSARLTAMAFLVSYSIASLGPTTMGVVADVTGSYGSIFALLAAVSVPLVLVGMRLRPGLDPVGEVDAVRTS